MEDVFKIGVAISLASNAEQVLGIMGSKILGVHGDAVSGDLEDRLDSALNAGDRADLVERLRRDRVAQQAEIDELRAWKALVIGEATRWAERDIAPVLVADLQNYVAAASYDERCRSLHIAAGAVKALEADLKAAREYVGHLRGVLESTAGVECYGTLRTKLRCFPNDRCSSCRARMALTGSFRE